MPLQRVTERIPLLIIFLGPRGSKIFERKKKNFLPYPKFGKFETEEGYTHLCEVPASWTVPKMHSTLAKKKKFL